jgi:Protein of unknown function (DUF2628)
MAVYTVHEPPLKRYDAAGDPDRYVFVRDGFSFWAFLLGPLWMLRHRMWLVLVGYLVLVGGMQLGLQRLGVEGGVAAMAGLLVALLIGFEAGTLRRFTLARRRWTNVGVIVGDDREVAEQRFFDAWIKRVSMGPWPQPQPQAGAQP